MLGFGVSPILFPPVEKAVSRKIGNSSLSWEQPQWGFSKSLLKNHLQRDWEMKRHFPAHEEIRNQRFSFVLQLLLPKLHLLEHRSLMFQTAKTNRNEQKQIEWNSQMLSFLAKVLYGSLEFTKYSKITSKKLWDSSLKFDIHSLYRKIRLFSYNLHEHCPGYLKINICEA